MRHLIFNLPNELPEFIDMRSDIIEFDYVVITPELAAMLLKWNTQNRTLSMEYAKVLAEYMKRGTFETTHQGIAFCKDGTLSDGQHRLQAIILSGKRVRMMVTVGLENNVHIDDGRKRSETDRLKTASTDASTDYSWIKNRNLATVNVLKIEFPALKIITLDDKAAYLNTYRAAFEFASSAYHANTKNLCSSAIFAAFVCAYIDKADPDRLKLAGKALATGLNPNGSIDPEINTILSLRNFLLTRNGGGGNSINHIICFTTAQALKHFLNGKSIRRTVTPQQFPFTVYDVKGNAIN